MIPIRDVNPSKSYPIVNNALIGVNVLMFLVQLAQGAHLDHFIYLYGLVPARYSSPDVASYFSSGQQVVALVSFMFLHGGFWHLAGNMWSLYIFGDNVEERLGPVRYLIFYLLCGLLSGFSHLILNLHSNIPTIGASGAIAGVMGAYLILFPHAKVLTLIPIVIIPYFIEIPAAFFLGLWFLLQFISAAGGGSSGIAWWAHIGGFIFGIILLKLFDRLPSTGFTEKARQLTARKTTERLQVIHPSGPVDDPNLYGTIHISPYEAHYGAAKLVNIPWGFYHQRTVRVIVPPGMSDGQMLRLRGMGKRMADGSQGDLMLTVSVDSRYGMISGQDR